MERCRAGAGLVEIWGWEAEGILTRILSRVASPCEVLFASDDNECVVSSHPHRMIFLSSDQYLGCGQSERRSQGLPGGVEPFYWNQVICAHRNST